MEIDIAKQQLIERFTFWYAERTGILVVGMITVVDGRPYKVVHHNDACPGHFVVCEVGTPTDTPTLLRSHVLYHPATAAVGAVAMNEPARLLQAVSEHLDAFLREVPEAKAWFEIMTA